MLKVVHIAPFGPTRAGIYEAARDMAVADMLEGHDVSFVDAGIVVGNQRQEPQVGAIDNRGALALVTDHPDVVQQADVLVMHTGVPDIMVVKTQAPMVWVVHGRPRASFIPEKADSNYRSYTLVRDVASWPRTKAMVYFWPEYKPFWDLMVPPEKHVVLDYPPIDQERFAADGPIHLPGSDWATGVLSDKRGKWNGLICDSWREDVDIFEAMHGALEACKRVPGLKWHLYAMGRPDCTLEPCWAPLLDALRSVGGLGDIYGRMADMDRVYRGVDLLLTPHRIVTRCIGESLCCGTPVVAGQGCKAAHRTARMDEPHDVGWAVADLIDEIECSPERVRNETEKHAAKFDLPRFGEAMTKLYRRILAGEPVAA